MSKPVEPPADLAQRRRGAGESRNQWRLGSAQAPAEPSAEVVTGFGCYADYLEKAVDTDLYAERGHGPETAVLVEEARVSCVTGMLLCLDRDQRVVLLLGEIGIVESYEHSIRTWAPQGIG